MRQLLSCRVDFAEYTNVLYRVVPVTKRDCQREGIKNKFAFDSDIIVK
jgi:hypothetical protein